MPQIDLEFGYPLFIRDKACAYLTRGNEMRISDVWSFLDYVVKLHRQRVNHVDKIFMESLLGNIE